MLSKRDINQSQFKIRNGIVCYILTIRPAREIMIKNPGRACWHRSRMWPDGRFFVFAKIYLGNCILKIVRRGSVLGARLFAFVRLFTYLFVSYCLLKACIDFNEIEQE